MLTSLSFSDMIVTANDLVEVPTRREEMRKVTTSPVLQMLRKCNSFLLQGLTSSQGHCRPLFVGRHQIGVIRPDVAGCLLNYPQVFTPVSDAFVMNPQLDTYASRSDAVELVLRDLRSKDVLRALRGWRDECFDVWADFGSEALFRMERSAVTVLGVRAFGVHVTGYVTSPSDGRTSVWMQKRSATKPTYPGMLDSMVGGGVTAGLQPLQVMAKEAREEASIPEELAKKARPAGAVSFFRESERGLHANTEFVFDLELPRDFVPNNSDGEVEGFEMVPVEEFLERVTSAKYKLTSVPIAVDFLVRHGFITPETEEEYPTLVELLHVPLDQLYRRWPQIGHQDPLQ